MSKKQLELSIGALTIILSILGSLLGTVWYASSIATSVEKNTETIQEINGKIEKLTIEIINLNKKD